MPYLHTCPAARRYELEKALVEGSIQVADLPRLWNEVRGWASGLMGGEFRHAAAIHT